MAVSNLRNVLRQEYACEDWSAARMGGLFMWPDRKELPTLG